MSEYYVEESKHFFFKNLMYNLYKHLSLFVEIFMDNFGIFYFYLKKEDIFLKKDIFFLEIMSIEGIILSKQSYYFFSTNSNIHN